jgi:uncharacterized protein with PIN domain
LLNRLRYYIDENLTPEIALQLQLRGIDAISVRDLDSLGETDEIHLQRATEMGRIVVTTDVDFLRLAASGVEHAGIIFGRQQKYHIGDWVKELASFVLVYDMTDFVNHVEYI